MNEEENKKMNRLRKEIELRQEPLWAPGLG